MNKMNVGVSLHSYVTDIKKGNITVDDAIRHAHSVGARCIEIVDAEHVASWPRVRLRDLFHLKELIESLDMTIVNYSQYTELEYSADYFCTEDELVDQVRESILIAHILGCPLTRVTPFDHVDPVKNRVIERTLPTAEKYKVVMGFEIHSPVRPDHFLEVMEQFKSPFIGLVPDFSTWWYKGGLPLDSFRACLPWTVHVHGKATAPISDNADEPNIPYKDLMSILKDYGYTGSIVAEYEPVGFDAESADCRKGVESLVKYIKRFV